MAGFPNVYAGNYAAATLHAERALRLSPFDPLAWHTPLVQGLVAFVEGRYADAAAGYAKSAEMNPGSAMLRYCTASMLALAGRIDEGKAAAAEALRINPQLRIRMVFETGLLRSLAEKLAEGLGLLGLPE